MDELSAALSGFGVSKVLNDPGAPHPRYVQYKQKTGVDQNERRRRILENQKQRRFDAKAHIRALSENCWDGVPENEENMDTDQVKPRHPGRYYRDQLMLSEWMIDVPDQLEEEWVMVACPVGKRCLVIAGSGYSSAYAKSGHYVIQSFQSHLPGGCRKNRTRTDSTILDCIYSDVERTFYILDMMCWNDMEVYNTDIEFRIFWLTSKLNEWKEDLTKFCDSNQFRFVPLKFLPCDERTISDTVEKWSPDQLDGLLFYHKRVHYLFGANPLCLWLQAYMLPDLLHIPVSPGHSQRAPQNYTFLHHTEQVLEKKAKLEEKERLREERREKEANKMEEGSLNQPLKQSRNQSRNQSLNEQVPESSPMEEGMKEKKGKKKKGKKRVDEMQTEPLDNEGGSGDMQTEPLPREGGSGSVGAESLSREGGSGG